MKLKTKLVALSLLTLLLPWSGWKLLQELERYLREAQESSLLGAARMAAGALPLEFQTRLLFAPDLATRLRALPRPPSLDGYGDDWPGDWPGDRPGAGQALEFRSADGALTAGLLAGAHGGRLFLLLDVRGAGSSSGGSVTLLTRNPRGLQRFHIAPGAPGPLQLRSETEAVGQGEGFWLDTPAGFALELSLPAGSEDTDVSFRVTDQGGASGAQRAAGPQQGQWIALQPEWARLSAWLARTVDASTRAWLVDPAAWVLADSGAVDPGLDDSATAAGAASPKTTWLQRFLYRQVAGSRTELLDEWPLEPLRLQVPSVTRALAGQEGVSWSQERDTARVRNTVAVPSEGLLLVTNRALGRLVFTTLALALGLAAGLWYFASRLSRRVRRLSSAVSRAMEDRVEPESLPLRQDRDELGDLARNNEKLLRAVADYSQYLQTLAGKLSHELKTPLAITRSSLDNLASQDLDPAARRFLQRAQEGVERQAAIVRAMSEASRLEAAIGAADWEPVDLAALVERCVAGYRALYAGRKLSLQLQHNSLQSGSLRLRCAPDLLAQALDKLVDNAMSLSGPDDEIAISLKRAGNGCELAVRNSGSTLPEDFKDRLFDSLVSVRANRDAEPHLGLGLYIVRLVVAAHDGQVSARNLPAGAGVEFLIRLPVA
ncbi:MAG: ATP-binding protein [Xanthomonadales bacterium]|nr:ATP-binding protein [Xanthomonadales bacterium]